MYGAKGKKRLGSSGTGSSNLVLLANIINNIASNKMKSRGYHTWLTLQAVNFRVTCNRKLRLDTMKSFSTQSSSLFWAVLEVPLFKCIQVNVINQGWQVPAKFPNQIYLKNNRNYPKCLLTGKQRHVSLLNQPYHF